MRVAGGPAARRIVAWALRAVGPIILVFLLVRVVDYGELRELLRELRYGWLVAAVGAVQLIVLFRTLRWMELHAAFGLEAAPFSYQLRLTYATSLATLVLPQIVNPLSRLVLLLQDGYRTGRSLAASISEKLLDLASYVVFGVIGSIALASTFGGLVWWAAGLAAVSVAGVWVAYRARARLGEGAARLIDWLPGLGSGDPDAPGAAPGAAPDAAPGAAPDAAPDAAPGAASDAAQDILSLDRTVTLRVLLWSLAISLTQATMLFFITRSVGIDLSYPFMVAVWGIIALSMLLPLSVNGVGTREAILVTAFSAVDRSTDAAVAIGLLTLVIVGIGSSPGLFEWVRRTLLGSGRRLEKPAAVPESGRAP